MQAQDRVPFAFIHVVHSHAAYIDIVWRVRKVGQVFEPIVWRSQNAHRLNLVRWRRSHMDADRDSHSSRQGNSSAVPSCTIYVHGLLQSNESDMTASS